MYLTEDLFNVIRDPTVGEERSLRYAELEATLADFVTSRTLSPEYIKLLQPPTDCVWEVRCVMPDPSIRVFGFFAERDSFIATNHELRPVLAEFDSEEWQFAKARAKSIWNRLFSPLLPRAETEAKLLITGAIDEQYFI